MILDPEVLATLRRMTIEHYACSATQTLAQVSQQAKCQLAAHLDLESHVPAAALYEAACAAVAIELPKRDLLDCISRLYDELLWHDQAAERATHAQPEVKQ